MKVHTLPLLVISAWSAGIQAELGERKLMKYTQNPHPSLSRRAGEGKIRLKIPSPIPMGEGEGDGEGNFIVVGERRLMKHFVEVEEDSQC